jgi:hypothetical protein
MNSGKLIFAQLMEHIPFWQLQECVSRYQGDRYVKTFSCRDQFLAMAFAQLTSRESLRDIEACLRAQNRKLYHLGLRGRVSRNTLSNANMQRDWRIWQDLALLLIAVARKLYAGEDFGVELAGAAYALDATTIDLCLSLFPWASFRSAKGGIKLHTLLDLRGNIPTLALITPAAVHEVKLMDQLCTEAGAIYIADRGYLDFARLWRIKSRQAFFLTRAKRNTRTRRLASRPVDRTTGLVCDQEVVLTVAASRRDYPERLRRVVYVDPESGKRYVFLTNHFELPALTIAQLYKRRWQVELFFKWIKQHLRIKAFFGTSDNAVRTQLWIALSVYVLVAIVKKRLELEPSLYTILQVLGLTVFEKMPLKEAFSGVLDNDIDSIDIPSCCIQPDFFDF